MAWQDRPYYRESGGTTSNPFMWLLTGSVPLFTAFGIRVRAHASLVLYVALVLLLGLGQGFTWQDRVQSMSILFVTVLLHEFGHCFTARWVGGEADDILMHPLGGLAMAQPPRRPLPTFLTILGGPAVNFVICSICGALLWWFGWHLSWNPFHFQPTQSSVESWFNAQRWVWWIYQINLMILGFNLLPIFPLDGGQMVQTILWPWVGYYKSMNFSLITGMAAAGVGGMIAIAGRNFNLAILAAFGFLTCFSYRRQLIAIGPEEYSDETDYSAAYEPATPKRKPLGAWRARRSRNRAMKEARQERQEQQHIDAILAKISAHGKASLNGSEKRALKKATEHKRRRDPGRK